MTDHKYFCDMCDYKTNDRCSWYNHRNSKKHIMREKIRCLENSNKAKVEDLNIVKKQYENSNNNNDTNVTNHKTEQIELINKNHEIEILKEKMIAMENEKNMIKEQLIEAKKQIEMVNKEKEKRIDEAKKQIEVVNREKEKRIDEAKKQIEMVNREKEKCIDEVNKEKEKRISEIKEHLETLKYENQFQKQIINSAGGMIKKSMNTLSYLLLNYKNAPHIKELPDYSIICKNISDLVKNLTYYHDKNTLDKYIGDFIIRHYKREEPELQSVWSSDTDRLNYFICELIKEQKTGKKNTDLGSKTQWVLDKKGIKMSKYIIKPLLEYIHSMNSNYINQKNEEIIDNDTNVDKILKEMQILASINADIKNNKLSTGINKYIAPHFYFDKNLSIEN